MDQIIAQLPILAQIIPYVIVLNVVLSAAAKILEVLKLQEKFPIVAKIAGYAQKLVDAISANPKH